MWESEEGKGEKQSDFIEMQERRRQRERVKERERDKNRIWNLVEPKHLTAKVLDSHLDANGARDTAQRRNVEGGWVRRGARQGRERGWAGSEEVVQLKCSARWLHNWYSRERESNRQRERERERERMSARAIRASAKETNWCKSQQMQITLLRCQLRKLTWPLQRIYWFCIEIEARGAESEREREGGREGRDGNVCVCGKCCKKWQEM